MNDQFTQVAIVLESEGAGYDLANAEGTGLKPGVIDMTEGDVATKFILIKNGMHSGKSSVIFRFDKYGQTALGQTSLKLFLMAARAFEVKDGLDFQSRVGKSCRDLFGLKVANNIETRCYRFLEEALELVQALGCTREAALKLVDYVYGRPKGVLNQEIGGTMVTLAALCEAVDRSMSVCGDIEIERCETPEMRAKILAKQTSKLNPTDVLLGEGA
jgi:hypothetical protein